MREYVKNLVTEIISFTPPQFGKKLKGTGGQEARRADHQNQIRRVFQGVINLIDRDHFEYKNSVYGMGEIHKRARVKGWVRGSVAPSQGDERQLINTSVCESQGRHVGCGLARRRRVWREG